MEGNFDGENTKKESESMMDLNNHHGNLKTASSDQNHKDILLQIKSSKIPAVINYGASWCGVCNQILPAFCKLSNNFPKLSFIYADIDECPETTQHIRYTPTFHFYRDGERVDEMFGAGEERLHDRLDVRPFILTCKVQYCSLYDQGYASIGSVHDTVPNALPCINDSSNNKGKFNPAYLHSGGRLERAGRVKKISPSVCGTAVFNEMDNVDSHKTSSLKAC